MTKIKEIHGTEILDSRGNPTIHTKVTLDNGTVGCAAVPSGASTGEHEALELRDHDPKRYFGKGVLKAVANVNGPLAKAVEGMDVSNQKAIDQAMLDADGTENKSKYGANAILGISMASAVAHANGLKQPLYTVLGEGRTLPVPMMNIINGGEHADNSIDFQEFMIFPHGPKTFREQLRAGAEIFHSLKSLLAKDGQVTAVGDEGGFAPNLGSNEEALDFIMKAIDKAGYSPGKDVSICLDCAASSFCVEGDYFISKKSNSTKTRDSSAQVAYLKSLTAAYPIVSIEDGLDENDWAGWAHLNQELGATIQIVGDDLFVTNRKFLQKGIDQKSANAILIKLNQIGTLTETLETIQLAKENNLKTVISHRSGETEDTFIADLAVGTDAGQIKTGSLSRSDRIAKYNQLLRIEDELGKS